ncbi:MAG: hypothetical protein WAU82_07060 [Candidatus Binatus sp.]|uniref:hypothetical protein n=1 Tax=Candidatus Binatus sp. TaxID=2811406 RepID=UPI003BAEE52B
MNSKRGLMTVLVGLAMLATPIAAAAKDYKHSESHAARAAARSTWMPAPAMVPSHRYGHRGWDANAYRAYGNPGYYAAPAYVAAPAYPVAAPYYGGGYAGGGGCGSAARVMNTYARDRATGHPAAAYDLLRQNQWALHSGCAGGAPVGGGLLGGLGGYRGAPAYNNYGGGNGGLLGGLGGYRGAPAYGNTGYGQPNGGGSMLSPLMQYIR